MMQVLCKRFHLRAIDLRDLAKRSDHFVMTRFVWRGSGRGGTDKR